MNIPESAEPVTARFVSIPERRGPILNDIYIRQGRYPEISNEMEVLASEAFANANHLQTGDRISAILNGRLKDVRIVGIAISPEYIYEIRGTEVLPDSKHFGVFWTNRKALEAAFNMDGAFNDLAITLSPGASQGEMIASLDRIFEKYGALGAFGREDHISHNFIKGEIDETSITSTYIPGIFLGISAFLIYVVLSRLVSTQRNQIGVLKAFGFSNTAVGFHYLKFSFLCVLGGAIVGTLFGLWAGSALAKIYVRFFHFPIFLYSAGPDLVLLGFGITFVSAAIGSIGAVRLAIDLPPAEAMRPEKPASFRAGWLERLRLQRWVPIQTRMIARNIARKPVKAGLSVLGLACAVAVMIVGLFAFDAIEYLMHVQFRVINRQDLSVVFQNPMNRKIVYELKHYPGVFQAEPFRMVAVRLRYQHRSKRVGITGLTEKGELHRIVDQHLNKMELPSSGLIMTTALAKALGTHSGDKVIIEVLEGSKPVHEIVVAGIVDEPVGLYGDSCVKCFASRIIHGFRSLSRCRLGSNFKIVLATEKDAVGGGSINP